MSTYLVTGGAGFFGSVLKSQLLSLGHQCVSLDLHQDEATHRNLTSVKGDIRNKEQVSELCRKYHFDAVFHCAAILAHAVSDKQMLWTSNVDGTRIVAECAREFGIPKLIFTSSNCLWGKNLHKPVREDDAPYPVEIYGRSKLEGEKVLDEFKRDLCVVTIRCPTIIDSGRLGLLSILYDFIREGRKIWVVGGGRNRYQFIFAQDLSDACIRAAEYDRSDTFHIGSDDVVSLREVFEFVIRQAGSRSDIASLPRTPALLAMQLAYYAGVSPLGPYHFKMIAEDFLFDTQRIKDRLGWRPTLTNGEMLWRAYQYYDLNHEEITGRRDVSAHRQPARMGVIRLLKWIS